MTLTGHRCSERKQTEAALSEREAQLRDLFDNAPVGIFHSNLEGRMVEANPALASMLGYSSPDELTTAIADMTIQLYDDPELCPRIMAALLDSDGWVHYDDVVWRCRDNRRIRVDMTGRKVLDNTGAIAYLEGFIEDITERKHAEEEILRNNKRLQRLANILQHPSETIQEFLDYALEQALQLTDSKLGYIYHYHEDSREFVLNTWSRDVMPECAVVNPQTCYALDQTGLWGEAVRQRRPILVNDFQVAHPLKKGYPPGHVHLSRFLTVPVFRDDHIVGVVGVANKETDYTETDIFQVSLLMDAVWSVTERRQAEAALQASDAKFSQAFIASTYAIIITRVADGTVIEVNPAFEAMVGYSRADALGKTTLDLALWEDSWDRQHFLSLLIERGRVVQQEYRFRKKGGAIIIALLSARLFTLNDERVLLGNITDITERKRMEEELARSKDAAAPPTLSGARVLLVEDNDINQLVAREILAGFGLVVEMANNGRVAVERLRAQPTRYALVLMDLQMPEMDGFEATRLIRRELGLTELPIIAMTAHALADERHHCLASGMQDHVAKPIDPPTLRAALTRWLAPPGQAAEPPQETLLAPDLPAALPGINLPSALARLSGNRELLLQLLRHFRQEWSGAEENIRLALATDALVQARMTVHMLRGVAGNLSMNTLVAAAQALEQALKEGDQAAIEPGLEALAAALAPVLAGLARLPPAPPPPVATVPLDGAALTGHLSQLAELLRRQDMAAEASFAALRERLGAGDGSDALNRMAAQMDRLDFSAAAATLTEVAALLEFPADEASTS